jgi:hypothetical protein
MDLRVFCGAITTIVTTQPHSQAKSNHRWFSGHPTKLSVCPRPRLLEHATVAESSLPPPRGRLPARMRNLVKLAFVSAFG